MPQIAPPLPELPDSVTKRIRWTKSQCRAIVEAGILTGRYELVDGDIIPKMSQNPPHAFTVRLLIAWLNRVFGDAHVQCQLPITVRGRRPRS